MYCTWERMFSLDIVYNTAWGVQREQVCKACEGLLHLKWGASAGKLLLAGQVGLKEAPVLTSSGLKLNERTRVRAMWYYFSSVYMRVAHTLILVPCYMCTMAAIRSCCRGNWHGSSDHVVLLMERGQALQLGREKNESAGNLPQRRQVDLQVGF